MPKINFYLKDPNSKSNTLIYLFCRFKGITVKVSTGESIEPRNWNFDKQRAKKNGETAVSGKYILNDLLDNYEKQCDKIYNEELANGKPDKATLQERIKDYINPTPMPTEDNLFGLIDRFINNEITINGKPKEPATIKTYKTTRNHLVDFQAKERYKINFESITLDFYHKFTSYLNSSGITTNAISKYIQVLKTFMSEAAEQGLTDNFEFKKKKFAVKRMPTDAVYLTEKEILRFYRYDLSGFPSNERARDLFVFGCLCGLRYSDYANVKPENIVEDEDGLNLKIRTQKTGELVYIPCHPLILEIFEKYSKTNSNSLPRSPSNQKFNDYIKEAAKKAGLNEKGKLASDLNAELWQCISSHTARRSFATNLYLQGFPSIEIMKITGHRTERAFLTYIKVSKLESAKRLRNHFNQMLNNSSLNPQIKSNESIKV